MLKLRLQRRGKKNYATYRVVVADQRAPIKGKFLADVGSYNPHTDEFKVREEIVKDWLGKGVQPSATVNNLLVNAGIIQGDKMTSWRPKVKKEEEGDKEKTKAESKDDAGEEKADNEAAEKKPDDKEKNPPTLEATAGQEESKGADEKKADKT